MTDAIRIPRLQALATAILAVFLMSGHAPAQAQTKVTAGTLTCNAKGTTGLILGSKESLTCTYDSVAGGPPQFYSAVITKVGLDIGVKGASTMIWSVLGAAKDLPEGQLAGQYGGVSADAAVGVGGGANALVGGGNNGIVLQPLSIKGQVGLNLSVGVAELRVTYEPQG